MTKWQTSDMISSCPASCTLYQGTTPHLNQPIDENMFNRERVTPNKFLDLILKILHSLLKNGFKEQ